MLQDELVVAKVGFDTAENGPSKAPQAIFGHDRASASSPRLHGSALACSCRVLFASNLVTYPRGVITSRRTAESVSEVDRLLNFFDTSRSGKVTYAPFLQVFAENAGFSFRTTD